MKQKINYTIILIIGFICISNIYALENSTIGIHDNQDERVEITEKVDISKEETEKIMLFGYTEEEIDTFSRDRIESLLKFDENSYSIEIKYFRDTYVYISNEYSFFKSNSLLEPQTGIIDVISIEISKEEYDKINKNDNFITTLGSVTHETTYKKLTLIGGRDIFQPDKRYALTNLQWKIMPSVRSFDVIAMKATGGYFDIASQGGKVEMTISEADSSCALKRDHHYTVNFTANRFHSQNWSFDYNGIGQTVLLPTNNIKCFNDLGMPLYNTLKKFDIYFTAYLTPTSGLSSVYVNATYQHSVVNVAENNVVKKYVFSPANLGNTIHFTNGLNSSFDGMKGVSLTVY